MPPPSPPIALQALQALDAGLWGLADKLAGQATDANPQNAAAWNVRGRLAMAARRPDLAVRWFSRACRADSKFKPAAQSLRDAQAAAPPRRPPEPAYFLILAWGFGFFSDVDMALGGLLAAEIMGRTPILHWGKGSLFRDDHTDNAWTSFFEPVGSATLSDALARADAGVFHPRYTRDNLAQGPQDRGRGPGCLLAAFHHFPRPEPVCVHDFHTGVVNLLDWLPEGHRLQGATVVGAYRDLARRYLRPQASITAAAEAFERDRLRIAGGPVLAVHARGSDKVVEDPRITQAHATYPARVDAFLGADPRARVFLLTDSTKLLDEYTRRYGERLLTTDAARTGGLRGIHTLAAPSREALGRDVLLDALLAARCDAFLGYGMSNVSCLVRALKDWAPGTCTLVGPVMIEIRK